MLHGWVSRYYFDTMEINQIKQAVRVQTSILNSAEKKALIWLANRQPGWVTSDFLSFIGFLGAFTISAGYILSSFSPAFLWLASVGLVINWYGDSLDGTLARVRNAQRPIYGFYIDHTLDCISELIVFAGLGLSTLMDLRVSLLIQIAYLLMTINVTINTHLKSEFKLTYAKLGPTEFRLLAIILNTVLALSPSIREFTKSVTLFGQTTTLTLLDIVGLIIFCIIMVLYVGNIIMDARAYSVADPKK